MPVAIQCVLADLHARPEHALTAFCPQCGKHLNARVPAVPDCRRFHAEKKGSGFNYKYCPDCGVRL